MCLGVPGKIIDINGSMATVDFWGVRKEVLLNIVDEPVVPGDYILNHVGFAIRRIPPESVAETLALHGEAPVVLSGGCFQNARLAEGVIAALRPSASVYMNHDVPPGDGGIALGQAFVANAKLRQVAGGRLTASEELVCA